MYFAVFDLEASNWEISKTSRRHGLPGQIVRCGLPNGSLAKCPRKPVGLFAGITSPRDVTSLRGITSSGGVKGDLRVFHLLGEKTSKT